MSKLSKGIIVRKLPFIAQIIEKKALKKDSGTVINQRLERCHLIKKAPPSKFHTEGGAFLIS